MASAAKADLSVNGSDSLQKKMGFISNFNSTKKDHIHEEKVLYFTGNVASQHKTSTQKLEQSVANEPTSSKVLKEDFFRPSKVLDEGEEGLNRYLSNEISSKGVSRRILDDQLFEHDVNQNLPLTTFQALKFQGKTNRFMGPRSTQRNDEMLVKTGEVKIASLMTQKFHSAEGKRSTEAERMDKLLLFRSERGNKGMKYQRNHSEISDLSLTVLSPARNKRKDSGTEKKEKAAQQQMEKNNEQLKMIVNNLATAISYSFQNALALQELHSQEIDKSFLKFFLRREVRKMFLIKELIKELDAFSYRFKFHENDFKDICETVESLHSLMCHDLKGPCSEEIPHEDGKYYLRFITAFAIIGCIMAAIGLTVIFLGKWSGLVVFIFLVLVFFLMIRHLCKAKPLLGKN